MSAPTTYGEYFMKTNPQYVDEVLDSCLSPEDSVLQGIRKRTVEQDIPSIEVSAQQGKMLELLVRTAGAEDILEIGSLAGYSTVCLARGATAVSRNATVTTLEYEPIHAQLTCYNIERAGLSSVVEVLEGDAHDSLAKLEALGFLFDFVFIDADKESNQAYFQWADKLGTADVTIIVDNVIRDGRVIDPNRPDKLAFMEFLGRHEGFDCTVIQTTGSKGWDGFVLAKRKVLI